MRGAMLCGVLLLAGAVDGAESPDALAHCAQGEVSGSLKEVEARCPGVGESLRQAGLEPLLNAALRQSIAPKTLEDLSQLAQRYRGTKSTAVPDTRSLRAITAQVLGPAAAAGGTWWDRLWAEVRSWFAHHAPDPKSPWNRWLERLAHSNGFLLTLGYLCIGAVVLTAIGVLVNELKAAGILRRAGRRSRSAPPPPAMSGTSTPPSAGVAAQLLHRLVEHLKRTGRLHDDRSLTHRELAIRAELDAESQRTALASVAGHAEALVYGPKRLHREPDERTLQQAARLLDELTSLERP